MSMSSKDCQKAKTKFKGSTEIVKDIQSSNDKSRTFNGRVITSRTFIDQRITQKILITKVSLSWSLPSRLLSCFTALFKELLTSFFLPLLRNKVSYVQIMIFYDAMGKYQFLKRGCKCKNVKYLYCSSQHCKIKCFIGYTIVAGT